MEIPSNAKLIYDNTGTEIIKVLDSSNNILWEKQSGEVTVDVGSVIYADLTFTLSSEAIDTSKTPIAIVYIIDDTNVTGIRAIGINDENNGTTVQWTNNANKSISCATNGLWDGKEATQVVISCNLTYSVVQWCYNNYSTDGTNVGDWYLPSMKELQILIPSDSVKASFNKIGLPSWWSTYIWSTDQHSSTVIYARLYRFSDASTTSQYKTLKYYAVPCLDLTNYTLTYDTHTGKSENETSEDDVNENIAL